VRHPNIVSLVNIVDTPETLYLVMELVEGGELFDKIVAKGYYSERDACSVINKVTDAIQYLHSLNIVHRDLKPENLLVRNEDDTHVMVSDFGLGRILGDNSLMSTACGTPYYVAPEVLQAMGYSKGVDMWSLGVITYFVLSGFPPFMGDQMQEVVEQIMTADYEFPSPYWDNVTPEAKDFLKKLLVVEPTQRLSAEAALNHIWLKNKSAPDKPLNHTESMNKHNKLRKTLSFAAQQKK